MTEPAPPPTTPAGWYPDPKMPGTQRYWDGTEWSDHVAPAPNSQRPAQPDNSALVAVGIVTALLLPIVGFIVGCVVAGRDSKTGAVIIVLSLFGAAGWFFLLNNSTSSSY